MCFTIIGKQYEKRSLHNKMQVFMQTFQTLQKPITEEAPPETHLSPKLFLNNTNHIL